MTKEIVVITSTMQDFDELDKVKQSHHLKNEDIERWWINNKEE